MKPSMNEKIISRKLDQLNALRSSAPRQVLDWIRQIWEMKLDVVVGPLMLGDYEGEHINLAWQQPSKGDWCFYWSQLGGHQRLVDEYAPLWVHQLILSKRSFIEGCILKALDHEIGKFPETGIELDVPIDPEFVPPEGGLGRPDPDSTIVSEDTPAWMVGCKQWALTGEPCMNCESCDTREIE